jgi:LysM repeat protein
VKNRYRLAVLLIAVAVWFVGSSVSVTTWAQPFTHTVQKGDTLWSICEKYYEDADLWPKLWEMNPFITNPHLLKPGDVVTLLEKEPAKEVTVAETRATEPETPADESQKTMGINVSGLTNVETIGFLSKKKIVSWGNIASAKDEKVVLSRGDIVYVAFDKDRQVNPGDSFTVCKKSGQALKDSLTGKNLGFVVTFLGKIIIREQVSEDKINEIKGWLKARTKKVLFEAEIIKSYKEIHIGNPVIAYEPISPCVRPLPTSNELTTRIVAVKDLHDIIGQWSVVYLAKGFKNGIRRGNVFEIIKKKRVDVSGKPSFSEMVMGYLLILESRQDTATGVVVAAKKEFSVGSFVRSLDLTKAQSVLSILPECTVE